MRTVYVSSTGGAAGPATTRKARCSCSERRPPCTNWPDAISTDGRLPVKSTSTPGGPACSRCRCGPRTTGVDRSGTARGATSTSGSNCSATTSRRPDASTCRVPRVPAVGGRRRSRLAPRRLPPPEGEATPHHPAGAAPRTGPPGAHRGTRHPHGGDRGAHVVGRVAVRGGLAVERRGLGPVEPAAVHHRQGRSRTVGAGPDRAGPCPRHLPGRASGAHRAVRPVVPPSRQGAAAADVVGDDGPLLGVDRRETPRVGTGCRRTPVAATPPPTPWTPPAGTWCWSATCWVIRRSLRPKPIFGVSPRRRSRRRSRGATIRREPRRTSPDSAS